MAVSLGRFQFDAEKMNRLPISTAEMPAQRIKRLSEIQAPRCAARDREAAA